MENNYQLSRIHNYVHGLMSRDEMHALEREALDDPFLQDAIDGYRLQNGVDAKQLSILQKRLSERIETNITEKNKRFYSWQRIAVGMAAGVMFMVVCTLILMRYLPQQRTTSEFTEVEIMKDITWEYTIVELDDNDVAPREGWNIFKETLVKNVSLQARESSLIQVSFDVNADGNISNLVVANASQNLTTQLREIIRRNVNWEGKKGNFEIAVRKVNVK